MNKTSKYTTIKIWIDTRKKLRLLAALLDKNLSETMDQAVTELLEKIQNDNS